LAKGTGKQIILDSEDFLIYLGATENHISSESIFLIQRCWVYNIPSDKSFSEKVKEFAGEFRRKIKRDFYEVELKTNFSSNHILDLSIGEENYNNASKLHLHVEINLYQNKPYKSLLNDSLKKDIETVQKILFCKEFFGGFKDLKFVKNKIPK
jgi:hypothetical protein